LALNRPAAAASRIDTGIPAADLVHDDLWERIAPLIPVRSARRHRYHKRLPVSDRVALADIVYVLRKRVAWRDLPIQVVGCSGVTARCRLRDWTEAGVRPRLHEFLLADLRAAGLPEDDSEPHSVTISKWWATPHSQLQMSSSFGPRISPGTRYLRADG
jgi:transposase